MYWTGRRIARREDARFVTGQGRYVADLRLPGLCEMAILRSPHAHARVQSIDVSAARAVPGVIDIITFAELGPAAQPLPLFHPHPALRQCKQFPLAGDKVKHVGEGVAVVVATDRYIAEDACERIQVEYEPLPPVVGCERALAPDAPVVHAELGSNLAAQFAFKVGDAGATMQTAPVRIRQRLRVGRCSGQPIEGRGLVAQWHPDTGLTVWSTTQTPHMSQNNFVKLLGLPQRRVRVIAPDVGGGFGAKETFHPEDVLVALAAMRCGRPVRWLEDRNEHLLAAIHDRDQVHEVELGLDRDGRIIALIDHMVADEGAFVPWGIAVPVVVASLIPGPYRVPHYLCDVRVAYTNTGSIAPYRGAGRQTSAFVMNRMLDLAARQLGIDGVEIRLRNFIPPEAFPYDTGLRSRDGAPMLLDSGNYAAGQNLALQHLEYEQWREEQARARKQGRYLGIGVVSCIMSSGLGPHEGAVVRVEPSGRVVVYTGATSQGQGHETALAQVCADYLGVDPDQVDVIGGDTGQIPIGSGAFASRLAVVAGSAVALAATAVKEKALAWAAERLEARAEDLTVEQGRVAVRGSPEKGFTLGELAWQAAVPYPGWTMTGNLEPGLEATRYFCPQGHTYPSSTHAAVVEVDPETGKVQILRYVAVHDCGNLLNPLIVEGQVIGGMAAGLGNALYEEVLYDEQGQLLTGTLMDYLLPTAVEVPRLVVDHTCTPSPINPLGAKGAGEAGTVPVPACINGAVEDALAPFGIIAAEMPLTPVKIRQLVATGGAAQRGGLA